MAAFLLKQRPQLAKAVATDEIPPNAAATAGRKARTRSSSSTSSPRSSKRVAHSGGA